MLRDLRDGLARFSPQTRRFLWGCAAMGAAQTVPWTLLALYLDRCGYSKAEIGAVQAAEAWGKVLVAIPAAILLARLRTPPVLVISSVIAGACYLALPWLPSLAAIQVVNVFAGLAWSVHYVAIAPFLFRHSTVAERAAVFGLADAVHTGAAVAGSFAAGALVTWLTSRMQGEREALAFALSGGGVLALLAIVPYGRIREESAPRRASIGMLRVLRENRALLVRFAIPHLVIACGAGLCIPFLGLYFQDRFAVAPGAVANLYAAGQVLVTLGFLATPWLLARTSFVRSIVILELASIPFFLLLAFTTSLPIAVGAFLARGALMNAAAPVLKHFSMRAAREEVRELQNGITSLVYGLGWVIGPQIGGRLLDASGDNYRVLMCTTVGFYVAAAAATMILLSPLEKSERVR
jgi:predicted MFS family arabinose efflux permease